MPHQGHSRTHAVLTATAIRTWAMARFNCAADRRSVASQAPSAAPATVARIAAREARVSRGLG